MSSTTDKDGGYDPLTHALVPPPGETNEEREARIEKEKRAKIVSDAIDEGIEAERIAAKRGPKPIKILLLGQSESGKSTTLKNFQLMYEPKAFQREKASWRSVIQLNLVQSFHLIIDAFTREQQAPPSSRSFPLPTELLKTKTRLMALLAVEEVLRRRLTPEGSGETEPTMLDRTKSYMKELAVNSSWKVTQLGQPESPQSEGSESDDPGIDWDNPNDPGRILHECSQDMIRLWSDPITHQVLANQELRMQEVAGFFLDQLERVTAPRYIPSDDDILRARLKTLGVTEHRFKLSGSEYAQSTGQFAVDVSPLPAGELSRDWRVFDVGGHRSQRAAWVPYFDDMNAIIFLAPISCFDQTLAEDKTTNRLQDSFDLWNDVTKNQLLSKTDMILFLNKVDIFQQKLDAGVKFGDYVVSYEEPNDFPSITDYMRRKFKGSLKKNSMVQRPFYCHLTTVTDTASTRLLLINVEETIMRQALIKGNLL